MLKIHYKNILYSTTNASMYISNRKRILFQYIRIFLVPILHLKLVINTK